MKSRILSPPCPDITILQAHLGDRTSNKRISDIRAGWRGGFLSDSGGFSAFFVLPDPGPLSAGPSVFIFAIICCLFTYASESPDELVKMKIPGPSFRDSVSIGVGFGPGIRT